MAMQRVHLRVRGRVQGVAFRAYAAREAKSLGLHGWVRNLPDGSVEILAEGPREQLEEMAEWAHRGSPSAIVRDVEVEWLEFIGDLDPFTIRYS